MVSEETMMFRFGAEENKAENIIRKVCAAMEEKGYNPINQLVGYLLSGDPAYVTSHNDARSMRVWILPLLGDTPLVQIGFAEWDALVRNMSCGKLSQRTKEYAAGTLRRLMRHACTFWS